MAAYQLVVFDWDGTLMDSEARIVDCMQRAATDLGWPVPSVERARDVIGLGLDEAVARVFPGTGAGDVQALVTAYRRHWLGGAIAPAPLFAGARELVAGLAQRGVLLAVATGKSRRGLERALQESGLGRYFAVTRCADETRSKPNPQMLEEILTDLAVEPAAALMVGDTEYDMQMADNARVAAVGLSHGVHATERLLAHGARQCFDDLFALAAWLQHTAAGPTLEV